MENEKELLSLRKARFFLWLNHWFGTSIPLIYEATCQRLVLDQAGYDLAYVQTFLKNNSLLISEEMYLVEKYAKSHPNLMFDYILAHSLCSEAQVMLVEMCDADLVKRMIECFNKTSSDFGYSHRFHERAQLALVEWKNPDALYKLLSATLNDITPDCLKRILELKDDDMLMSLLCLRGRSNFPYSDSDEIRILSTQPKKVISRYLERWRLFDYTLSKLIKGQISCDLDTTSILQHHIEHDYLLSDEVLMDLISYGFDDILKQYYLKHGLSPQVLSYYCNLRHFKEDFQL